VYNAFIQKGSNAQWCSRHCLNYRVLRRAVSIRQQLRSYLTRFKIPIQSCNGDTTAIRKCLTSGYFAHAARMQPDGSLLTLRDNAVGNDSDYKQQLIYFTNQILYIIGSLYSSNIRII
jgi:ATP-dependent RNA helicase DDX35